VQCYYTIAFIPTGCPADQEGRVSLDFLVLQVLNGLTLAALLFLVASGFTLVFGVMRIVNLAHGSLYLLGGSIGISVAAVTGVWALGLVAATIGVGAVGLLSERLLLHRVRGRELPEVLLTVGIALVIADLVLALFGGNPRTAQPPAPLVGAASIGPVTYPTYRLFVIAFAVAIGVLLQAIQQRTRIGAILRAGVDDREMVSAMGINVDRVFATMFLVGSMLAGMAGMIAAGLLTIRPGADTDILLFALVVVIVGGLGSVPGAAVGSVLIGLIDAFSRVWLPELSSFAVFAPMAIILVLRPAGLFGRTT
jgi:branched-chain amino acid transport system permease protein